MNIICSEDLVCGDIVAVTLPGLGRVLADVVAPSDEGVVVCYQTTNYQERTIEVPLSAISPAWDNVPRFLYRRS